MCGLLERGRELRCAGLRRLPARNGERELELLAFPAWFGLRDLDLDSVILLARGNRALPSRLRLLDSDMCLDRDPSRLPRLRLLDLMRSKEGERGRFPPLRAGLRLFDVSMRLEIDDLLLRRPRSTGLNELSLRLVFLSFSLEPFLSTELSEV